MRDIPHSSKRVPHLDLANCCAGMLFDFGDQLSLFWNRSPQRVLEVPFAGGIVGSYRWRSGCYKLMLLQH